jgi:hypothetical protein
LTIEFEGRETQAAESWRIRGVAQAASGSKKTLAILRFKAITKCIAFGETRVLCVECEGARYAESLKLNLQAKTSIELSI